jgi:2-polyprenyl-3-methyl-5-hydroxy-6-metoxy-1,4-benzoquinol methylase
MSPLARPVHTAPDIAEFLDRWLRGSVLASRDQAVLESYYASYKKHFGPYLRHHYARQTKELIELVGTLGRPRVLDVGCGCGTESLWAAMKGARVTGIDILPELLGVAQARLSHLRAVSDLNLDCEFVKASVLDLDGRERFDLIYLDQAFHHLEPRAATIDKLAELVRPGGWIVLSETNGWNPLHQLNVIRKRGFTTVIEHGGHAWGHERITVAWALVRGFRQRSLKTTSLEYYRVLPNWKLSDWFLFPGLTLPGFIRPLFTHFNLVLQKAE